MASLVNGPSRRPEWRHAVTHVEPPGRPPWQRSGLYDIDVGHPDRAVEDRIDHVGFEYLDQLIDMTSGRYFGEHVLEVPDDA